ncbi:hypothetical protein ILUMI_01563 [Ignelater luminosus]|uniref:Uncharacterized protein n=1 Tax=Ignelater luminosus TaxID=2038154 RepID=A0A8K0DE69_IGNLU|nr:hypothetical protein ILUMI_01563 [Ignelater luminosus]
MINNNHYVSAYGITHRLLFIQVAEALQCKWDKGWIDQKVKTYCSYIYWEALFNSKCEFLKEFDDLFLEQVFLCGYEGFMEFMTRRWMEHVLSIQTNDGCFGIFLKRGFRKIELRRKKREANLMKFGCLDHTTGLGAAVLSLFLRFLDNKPNSVSL